MVIDILNHEDLKDYDLSALQYCSLGGSPVPPSLIRDARIALEAEITVGYGMTENSCASMMTWHNAPAEIAGGSIGHPLPGVESKIIDPATGEDVPPGTVGEICTKGFLLFAGYVKDPEKTAEQMLPGGWWRTGDLAYLQENGTYKIAGRSKDMIIRGGENIQPTEIENYYTLLPEIDEMYVIGVPSKRLGEEVAAYIKERVHTSLNQSNHSKSVPIHKALRQGCSKRFSSVFRLMIHFVNRKDGAKFKLKTRVNSGLLANMQHAQYAKIHNAKMHMPHIYHSSELRYVIQLDRIVYRLSPHPISCLFSHALIQFDHKLALL